MKRTVWMVAALLTITSTLAAQANPLRPEIRPWGSVSVPIGPQRDFFKEAPLFGLQAALEVKPYLHVLGTFGWAPTTNKYVVAADKVNMLAYDAGVELGMVQPLTGKWEFKPFFGIGGGARTYLYEATTLTDRTCVAGYGAAGMEFQLARTALRFEARENAFCFKSPLAGAESKTRTDLQLGLGLAYHIR